MQVEPHKRTKLASALDSSVTEVKLHNNLIVAFEINGGRTSISLSERVPKVSTSSKKGLSLATIPLDVLEAEGAPIVLQVQWEIPKPKKPPVG